MNKLKVVFMGTPEFAARILAALLETDAEVAAVFTQPDKPVGRKQTLTPPPVKVLAEEKGIPVYQPRHVKYPKWVGILNEIRPDLILVAAFGQILSQEILDIPRFGCVNLHGSLLPQYRGAAPAQWAIANGEKRTGITAMQMDAGMDTGDMLFSFAADIEKTDTAASLLEKLSVIGAAMVPSIVELLSAGGSFVRTPQDAARATYAPILKKEDGLVDWGSSAEAIDCRLRGFTPWPGAYSFLEGAKVDFLETAVSEVSTDALPGTVLEDYLAGKHPRLLIAAGSGVLEVLRLQPQGRKAMRAEDYLRGADLRGKRFETPAADAE